MQTFRSEDVDLVALIAADVNSAFAGIGLVLFSCMKLKQTCRTDLNRAPDAMALDGPPGMVIRAGSFLPSRATLA